MHISVTGCCTEGYLTFPMSFLCKILFSSSKLFREDKKPSLSRLCGIAKNINAWIKKKFALIQGPTTNVWNCVWNYLKFCITATSPTSPLGWTKAAVLVAIRRRSYDMFKMHTNWCISIRTGKAIYIRFALILSNSHFQIFALVCNIKILFCILSLGAYLGILHCGCWH